jgi:hypothetical protein
MIRRAVANMFAIARKVVTVITSIETTHSKANPKQEGTMTNDLTLSKYDPPAGLAKFLYDLPLIGSEKPQDYIEFARNIAAAVGPVDAIGWILLGDVTYYSWLILRERRVKAWIVMQKQAHVRAGYYISQLSADTRLEQYARRQEAEAQTQAPTSAFKKKSVPEPAKTKEEPEMDLAKAYIEGGRDIDLIDTRIASYECRRNNALKDLRLHNESVARRLEAAVEEIEGEYTEV